MSRRKKWGRVGAPHSAKRRRWLRRMRRKVKSKRRHRHRKARRWILTMGNPNPRICGYPEK